VVPQIIHISVKINFLNELKVAPVEYPQFTFAARHEKFFFVSGAYTTPCGLGIPEIERARGRALMSITSTELLPSAATNSWFFPSKPKWSKRPRIPGAGISSVRTNGRGHSGVAAFCALIWDKKPKSNGIEKRKARAILMRPPERAAGLGQQQGAGQGGYTKRVDVAKGLVVEP
jgi:hypothetical protein